MADCQVDELDAILNDLSGLPFPSSSSSSSYSPATAGGDGRGGLLLSARLQRDGPMLRRSISTGQLCMPRLRRSQMEALELELGQQLPSSSSSSSLSNNTNATALMSAAGTAARPTAADAAPALTNDDDYAAMLLLAGHHEGGSASSDGGSGSDNTPSADSAEQKKETASARDRTNQAKQTSDKAKELFRELKQREASGTADDALGTVAPVGSAQVDHFYFVGWLRKARLFNQLDLHQRGRSKADNELDALMEAETVNYAKETLGYYQRCLSVLPYLKDLTQEEIKEAKMLLFAELARYYMTRSDYRKSLQIAVVLLSENSEARELQQILRYSVNRLADPSVAPVSTETAAFIVNTIEKLRVPIPDLTDFISSIILRLELVLRNTNQSDALAARISVVKWFRVLLAERQIKQRKNRPLLSVSLRLSGGVMPQDTPQEILSQESEILDLLVLYREKDLSEEVRTAAKQAIEQIGNFTLEIVEEGFENDEAHVIKIQVYIESLVKRSSYFKTMLDAHMFEHQTQRMRVITSQPYAFLDMIDFLYGQAISFESIEHALAICMVANQYGVEDLKAAAKNYMEGKDYTYIRSLGQDWDKLKEIYLIVDALGLDSFKKKVILHVEEKELFLHGAYIPPKGSDNVAQLRSMHSSFPDIFNSITTATLLHKIKFAVQQDNWELCDFIMDLLAERKSDAGVELNAPPPSSVSSPLPANMCGECKVVMGHLTTCSNFANFRNIAGRTRVTNAAASTSDKQLGFIEHETVADIFRKSADVNWMHLALRVLHSGFCFVNANLVWTLLQQDKSDLIDEVLNYLMENIVTRDQEEDELHEEVPKTVKGKEKCSGETRFISNTVCTWQWEGDVGDWQDYDKTSNQQLEDAFNSGAATLQLSSPSGSTYTIDFARQKQRNDSTNTERNIRRKQTPMLEKMTVTTLSLLRPHEHKIISATTNKIRRKQTQRLGTIPLTTQELELAKIMNGTVSDGKPLLHLFIEKHIDLKIIKKFLELGNGIIDLNAVVTNPNTGESSTALATAIAQLPQWDEAIEVISFLLSIDADPNVVFTEITPLGQKRSTALLLAIKQDNLQLAYDLIAAGADVNFNAPASGRNLSSYTLSQNAKYDPKEDMLASLNSTADRTPLFAACCAPQSEANYAIVEMLLAHRARLAPRESKQQSSSAAQSSFGALAPPPPLQLPSASTFSAHVPIADGLVRGNTPLMAAAFYGREDLVRLMLKDALGHSTDESTDNVKELDTEDGNVDQEQDKGKELDTKGKIYITKAEALFAIRAKNWWRWTPLHFAVYAGHEEIVQVLSQVTGAVDSEAIVTSSGIVNTARQMAVDNQLNRALTALCTLPIEKGPAQVDFQHSAELAPLQTFTSVSALGSGATATAMTRIAPKPKKKLWDRLKFL